MRLSRVIAMAVMLGGTAPMVAHADPPPPQQPQHPAALTPRQANYAWDNDLLRASFSYKDLLEIAPGVMDGALRHKLESGMTNVIVMRAYVYREGDDTPVALAVRVCRVNYDLWDEVYKVHLSEPEHERDQPMVLAGVLGRCTEARDLPVVRRDVLTAGQPYFLGVVVDLNPVSQQMMEQMRRWIARPVGSTGIGQADALFGGFVQLFVRQIAQSDKTITFRTQSVVP